MFKATATIHERAASDSEPAGLYVEVTWASDDGVPLDRPSVGGFGLKKNHRALAERLVRCVNAQRAYRIDGLAVDVNGKTYVCASSLILGRRMSADLKRLGF